MRKLAFWLAVAGTVAAALPGSVPAALPCAPWSMRTIASGLGSLENVLPDGTGGLLISATDKNAILRMTPDGSYTTLVSGVTAPGGLRIKDDILYFNTGNAIQSGAQNTADGTIGSFDLVTHVQDVFATGLVMPNGLAILPNGDFVVSRDVGGSQTGITRVPASDPQHPQTKWANLADTNGLAVDPTGTYLYTVETFTNASNVYRILISDPSQIDVVASLGNTVPPKGLDDMAIDGSGILYIAANGSGEVIRLDPRDKKPCVIASGMRNTSAVKFGAGKGWAATHLFVVGFDGVVRELTPPADQKPVPPGDLQQEQPGQQGPAAAYPMSLRPHPHSIPVGKRSCVRFTVIAQARRVREATVRFTGRSQATNSAGVAVFCIRPRRRGTLVATASKPGLQTAQTKVRVHA